MDLPKHVFREYDIRGNAADDLFDELVHAIGRALATFLREGRDSLIKKRMKEEDALLAGEMSGHIFFADRDDGFDDAIYAAARVVDGRVRAELETA